MLQAMQDTHLAMTPHSTISGSKRVHIHHSHSHHQQCVLQHHRSSSSSRGLLGHQARSRLHYQLRHRQCHPHLRQPMLRQQRWNRSKTQQLTQQRQRQQLLRWGLLQQVNQLGMQVRHHQLSPAPCPVLQSLSASLLPQECSRKLASSWLVCQVTLQLPQPRRQRCQNLLLKLNRYLAMTVVKKKGKLWKINHPAGLLSYPPQHRLMPKYVRSCSQQQQVVACQLQPQE